MHCGIFSFPKPTPAPVRCILGKWAEQVPVQEPAANHWIGTWAATDDRQSERFVYSASGVGSQVPLDSDHSLSGCFSDFISGEQFPRVVTIMGSKTSVSLISGSPSLRY